MQITVTDRCNNRVLEVRWVDPHIYKSVKNIGSSRLIPLKDCLKTYQFLGLYGNINRGVTDESSRPWLQIWNHKQQSLMMSAWAIPPKRHTVQDHHVMWCVKGERNRINEDHDWIRKSIRKVVIWGRFEKQSLMTSMRDDTWCKHDVATV